MEISQEKSETIAFLGQGPVRCKIVVDNKCLQQVKILNISIVKYPMKMNGLFNKN